MMEICLICFEWLIITILVRSTKDWYKNRQKHHQIKISESNSKTGFILSGTPMCLFHNVFMVWLPFLPSFPFLFSGDSILFTIIICCINIQLPVLLSYLHDTSLQQFLDSSLDNSSFPIHKTKYMIVLTLISLSLTSKEPSCSQCNFLNPVSQPWHIGPDISLLRGAVLCFRGSLAASLTSINQIPVTELLYRNHITLYKYIC